jgi:hypothetical protein
MVLCKYQGEGGNVAFVGSSIPIGLRKYFGQIFCDRRYRSSVNEIKMVLPLKPRTLEIIDHEFDIRRNPVRLYRAY